MNKRHSSQKGFAIIESLVSIALVGIAMVGITSLVVTSVNANTTSRSYTALVSDVNTLVDQYRNGSYQALLARFNPNPIAIADGQTITENSTGTVAKATYVINLTALKSSLGSIPEAVRVQINATQRRGIFNDASYTFETILAPTS